MLFVCLRTCLLLLGESSWFLQKTEWASQVPPHTVFAAASPARRRSPERFARSHGRTTGTRCHGRPRVPGLSARTCCGAACRLRFPEHLEVARISASQQPHQRHPPQQRRRRAANEARPRVVLSSADGGHERYEGTAQYTIPPSPDGNWPLSSPDQTAGKYTTATWRKYFV